MLLIFAMTMMYSITCPLITPFGKTTDNILNQLNSQSRALAGLLYLILKHLVDRYNIYFAYGPSKISQSIHETAISCVIVSIVLLQLSFLSLSLLRLGLEGISIFSLGGLVLTCLFVLSHVFLNCCKGFSPITYTRVRNGFLLAEVVLMHSTKLDYKLWSMFIFYSVKLPSCKFTVFY